MLIDALFRNDSSSLENPNTPITADSIDNDGLFTADVYVSPETSMKLAAVYACIYV
ncbi:phage portal protein, partial [Proteus columbae]|nr:phage portal protein [Proteus columbae]